MTREPRRPTVPVLHAQRDQVQSARLLGLLGWEHANSCLRYATITRNAAGVRTQLKSTVQQFSVPFEHLHVAEWDSLSLKRLRHLIKYSLGRA